MNTPGKRTPYISSIGASIKENEFNREVVHRLNNMLKASGFQTLLVAPEEKDIPLSVRTNRANQAGADAYISIHYNAYNGHFSDNPNGIELYVYRGHLNKDAGRLAHSIGRYLKQGTKQYYRGVKEADFHVLRETSMIAVLTESGFMDHPKEALLMRETEFQNEVAVEHAKGICDFFNLPFKASSKRPWYVGRRIESIYEGELRFYSQPTWGNEAIAGYVQKGYGFPRIVDRVKVEGYNQYKVENSKGLSFYITASETYVKVI